MTRRVVFDTTSVLSALLFPNGRLTWLRQHWRDRKCVPLISRDTAAELTRVLRYPKFGLSTGDVHELLSVYLPQCKVIERVEACSVKCRDAEDQPFLDLAHSGRATSLVSGDKDLLALRGMTVFSIETPEEYKRGIKELS